MLIDCHIHTSPDAVERADLIKNFDAAGVDKGILLSHQPSAVSIAAGRTPKSAADCLAELKEWAAYSDRIIPFFWIDPMDEDAFEQVDAAVAAGVAGFKVICARHFPGDQRPMDIFERIAQAGKPILFHSGILYSPSPSSKYNRPANFEPLLDIPNLRFAMAHVSWPWHDEFIAVYGYYNNRKNHQGTTTAELFIDTTPGTPKIYRNEVLGKLYTVGYPMEDNIIFGTDCNSAYRPEYTKTILARDKEALDLVNVTAEQREKYYGKNVLRFLGQ